MSALGISSQSTHRWAQALYLLVGVGPWIALLGFTAWEVIVPACTSARELWPPPSGAFLLIMTLGLPWLLVMASLTAGIRLMRQPVKALMLATGGAAIGVWLILLIAGPFAQSYAWNAMRAECQRGGLGF